MNKNKDFSSWKSL